MKKKQPYTNTLSNLFILSCLIALLIGCSSCAGGNVSDIEYFKEGEILLPDYACSDTLIVIDAAGLNKGMALIDGTDGEIDSVLHIHCKIK
jgi:hypothetical protein